MSKTPPRKAPPPVQALPPDAVYTVRSLAQARVLSDPLRVRILREFVSEPRTTKQVAERLGEKAPRLYRHVQALLDAGLLVRKGERKKRGTIERYLQAVASRFEVDGSIFANTRGKPRGGAMREMVEMARVLFADAERELTAYCDDPASATAPPTVARVLVRGSKKEVERVRARLTAVAQAAQEGSGDEGDYELSGLIAVHSYARKR